MNANRIIAVSSLASIMLAASMATPMAQQDVKIDFANETVGAEPKVLVPVVGIWRIESDAGKKVLAVDGRQWKEGQSSAGLADKARALYGERYAEFLDRVKAYAYFPYVVAKDVRGFPRWRAIGSLRRHLGPHRSGRRGVVQPQAQRRLSDRAGKPARK